MNEKMTRHIGSVSAATLLSRVLGYVRDALVAHAFGGGHLTDAFYAAFRLSNLFRRMLGEGPLSTAFVPVFSEHMARRDAEAGRRFFNALFTALAVVLLIVVSLMVWGAPWIVGAAAHGFKEADPGKFALTVSLTRLLSPFLFFVCLAALGAAALNASGRFFLPALAPSMLSVSTIIYVWGPKAWLADPMKGLAISTTLGGALHLLVLLPALAKKGLFPRWRWEPRHPDVARVALLVVPAIWGLSIDQVNAYVDTICASFLQEGSVTALYNSNRLMQFALALFGTAVSTATLPHMSECVARADWKGMKENLNYSLRLTSFAVIPAMAGLIVLAGPLVSLLFEHGRFTPENTRLTVSALVCFTVGLPAYAAVKILVSCFYAMKDTKTPVKIATLCLFVNIAGNLALMRSWGVGGLAFSTSAASVVNAVVLLYLLRRKVGLLGGRRILSTVLSSAAASAVMAAGAWSFVRWVPLPAPARVLGAVFLGAFLYLLWARSFGMDEYAQVISVLRRKKTPAA